MSSLDLNPELPATARTSGSRETLEDYTLRYAPLSFRRWGPGVVAVTALGGIAYLADFSIGASIGMAWGTSNAIYSILVAALVIFLTGIPLAITAARYNIDLDLITRSAGFGYFGSVITSIIFAGFTFIFFALEGSIMAQGLLVGLGIPLWMGYLIATLMVLPLVVYGMKALTRLQVWTTPLWLVLMVVPVAWLIAKDPDLVDGFMNFAGKNNAAQVDLTAIMLGAGVCLSLIMQIGEQIDYLRFMPPKTAENSKSWWLAVFSAIAGILGMAMLLLSPHTVLDPLGIGAAFLGAISMALGTWLSRRWALSLPIVALTGWQLAIGGVVLAPVALIVDPPLQQVTALQVAGYLWLCVAGAMLAYGLWFRGIGRLSPVAVSAMSLLSPVTAVVLGWIFLGQKIQGMALVGLIVVLASVLSIQRALARQAAGAKTKKAP